LNQQQPLRRKHEGPVVTSQANNNRCARAKKGIPLSITCHFSVMSVIIPNRFSIMEEQEK
jgi:hypothetical protein